ncbi:membrane hypothetical protein [Candidatus Nitrotoga sp. BS]|uniref:GGDEF domain-containing protein n=1 Tax=Candidatus Nitrotoga sp. BS TaxID=2890408 RepID=UPI001EF341FA|nr:GGDEF domain-containing protein [Candidatus Nitrotoga sp. BS]CAH1211072.1 membrane hypothetical protein [Candidatus Nitrotoga sp. BS]
MQISFATFSRGGAVFAALMGCAVLVGWLFDISVIKAMIPNLKGMKVNAAISFVAAGGSLWMLQDSARSRPGKWMGMLLALVVVAISAATLAEQISGMDFGIDEILIHGDSLVSSKGEQPGRMSPVTALCFFLTGFSLLTLGALCPKSPAWAWWLALPILLLSLVVLAGYAYGTKSLYTVAGFTTIPLHAAITFFLLSLSLLAANSSYKFTKLMTSDTAGGYALRRMLPSLILGIFIAGWLRLKGEEAGWYDVHFGVALMVLLTTLIGSTLITWIAKNLHDLDIDQRQKLATHDYLTGLVLPGLAMDKLEIVLHAARNSSKKVALLFIDLDGFKSINDTFGHEAGDYVLKVVADRLQKAIRHFDTPARVGGDEFLVILDNLSDEQMAAEIAGRIISAISQPIEYSGDSLSVGASIGIGLFPDNATDARSLRRVADQAMYAVKRSGKNRFAFAGIE